MKLYHFIQSVSDLIYFWISVPKYLKIKKSDQISDFSYRSTGLQIGSLWIALGTSTIHELRDKLIQILREYQDVVAYL